MHTVELGDFSKMDEQRYLSIGDGKVYLVNHNPLDEFDAVLRDMILDDTTPEFDAAERIEFSGSENYTILRDEDGKSLCADDSYFTDGQPLDTDNVETFLSAIQSLSLTNYVSYHVTDEELAAFGLNGPDLPDVTCYVRVGQSQVVYEISQDVYDQLTAVSYDTLRHQILFAADFETVTRIDVALSGENYTFTYHPPEDKDAEGTWTYNGEEFDVYDLETALRVISTFRFTDETPAGQEEISLTVHLDNEDFPTVTLMLYRLDGTNCVAAVDGKTVALVSRSKTVDLIEAVNELTLGG